ncbi:Hypothetical predicted protein [Cloeon dipterum]|uniref:Uncharacterized protein n=1 Tax=Cloeon dipterum TaxID=197152 RepID=A0A8S1E2Z4_9INSE|nr:Hypothetical predicted protein [Cloeon dipterum]
MLWERPYDRLAILEAACHFGDLEMCKWLLEEVEIDVNKFEDEDWKAHILIDVAVNRKNEASKILQYLFSRLSAAKFVHDKDGDLINEISADGEKILHLAAQFGSVEMCQWLIDQGQDLSAINRFNLSNFLHYAALNSINGKDMIKTYGKDFIEYVNQMNINFFTPLHFAMLNERQPDKVAEALLGLGADLNVKWKGNNLLHFCVVNRKLESAKFVDAKDKNMIKQRGEGGKTTLHIAVDNFDEDMCNWLVMKKGVNLRELSVGGKSVLKLASREMKVKKCLQSLITSRKRALCLICERPTADGAVLAVQVDKEKLQTWFLNVCEYELEEEIEDKDKICYFCLWHAEFQWKFEEMMNEELVWWPRNLDHLDNAARDLRKNYFEGKLEQCFVQLEKIELPESESEDVGRPSEAKQQSHIRRKNTRKRSDVKIAIVLHISTLLKRKKSTT